MREAKKLICVLLAALMLFSTLTVGVSAQYYSYKDGAITSTNRLDKPVLTTNQYAAMVMDEVDRMLAEMNFKLDFDLMGIATIKVDLRSIDKTMDTVRTLEGTIDVVQKVANLGDLNDLNLSALVNCPTRANIGTGDLDIFLALFRFLSDNSGILAKVIDGSLNLGILSSLVDLSDINIPQMLKEIVYEYAYPENAENIPEVIDKTLDEMLADAVNSIINGTYADPELMEKLSEYQDILSGLAGRFDVATTSVYDIILLVVDVAFNEFLVPWANDDGLKKVRELCGVKYDEANPDDTGDESSLNLYADLLNINFQISEIDFPTYLGEDDLFMRLGDILGKILLEVVNPELGLTWDFSTDPAQMADEMEANMLLADNLARVAKIVLKETGNTFFANNIAVMTDEEIDAMSTMELVSYIARSVVNAVLDDAIIPDSADTLIEVVNYAVMYVVGEIVPMGFDRDYDCDYYPDLDMTSIDSLLEMLGDWLANLMINYTDAEIDDDYSQTFDAVLTAVGNWIVKNYGGLFSDLTWNKSNTHVAWQTLNSIIFAIFPSNWLPKRYDYDTGLEYERNDLESILVDDILTNLFNLNFYDMFSMLYRNIDTSGELNKPLTEVLVKRLTSIINYVFEDSVQDSFSCLEDLANVTKLSNLVNNLLSSINANSTDLLKSLLPLGAQLLGLSATQEFEYPDVSLENTIKVNTSGDTEVSFFIYNATSGLNTAVSYMAPDGTPLKKTDALYKYRINETKLTIDGQPSATVSVARTDSDGNEINGGTYAYYTVGNLKGLNDKLLRISVEYDILDENGTEMTTDPLVMDLYSYLATYDDDGVVTATNSVTNNQNKIYTTATYLNQGATVGSFAGVEFELSRAMGLTGDDNKTKPSYNHVVASDVKLVNSTIDSVLTTAGVSANTAWIQNTTTDGGSWDFAPYTVAEDKKVNSLEAAKGLHINELTFELGNTISGQTARNLTVQHAINIYNDFGLPGAFNAALTANRQRFNYGYGDFTYKYLAEDKSEMTELVDADTCWAEYNTALQNAARVVLRPRQYAAFQTNFADKYEPLKTALDEAIAKLEACTVSSAVGEIEAALLRYEPLNLNLEYYEAGYSFMDKEDYLSYTYRNYRDEKNAAKDIVEAATAGAIVGSLEASYILHRLTLYGDRLIRVQANTSALEYEIAQAEAQSYDETLYFESDWNEYETALNFAKTTATEALGTTNDVGWLTTDGLRQSKVNVAREELILARKGLYIGADYTKLTAAVLAAASVASEAFYTSTSYAAFAQALSDARELIKDELAKNDDNQLIIDAAAKALTDAIAALVEIADYAQLDSKVTEALAIITGSVEGGTGTMEDVKLKYSEETAAEFEAAYLAALAINHDLVNNTENQNIINAIYDRLHAAIAALALAIEPSFESSEYQDFIPLLVDPTFPTDPIIDNDTGLERKYIMGFDLVENGGIAFFDDLIGIGGAEIEIVFNDNGVVSTGAQAKLLVEGEVVSTFDFIAFGDIDGDGDINGNDLTTLDIGVSTFSDMTAWYYVGNPYYFAADIDRDGKVDGIDITELDTALAKQDITLIGQIFEYEAP